MKEKMKVIKETIESIDDTLKQLVVCYGLFGGCVSILCLIIHLILN